jgi:hypothetical protein
MRQQPGLAVINGGGGLVAGGFDAQNFQNGGLGGTDRLLMRGAKLKRRGTVCAVFAGSAPENGRGRAWSTLLAGIFHEIFAFQPRAH